MGARCSIRRGFKAASLVHVVLVLEGLMASSFRRPHTVQDEAGYPETISHIDSCTGPYLEAPLRRHGLGNHAPDLDASIQAGLAVCLLSPGSIWPPCRMLTFVSTSRASPPTVPFGLYCCDER